MSRSFREAGWRTASRQRSRMCVVGVDGGARPITVAGLAAAILAGSLPLSSAVHAQTAPAADVEKAAETERQTPSGAVTLAPIEVHGAAGPVPGELPPPYAGGQVATGGSLGLIENLQARTAADVLINDSSVRTTTGSNGFDDTFQIRGFAVPAGDVGFNGLYGLVSPNHVPAELTERIELIKGPNALINGIAPNGSIGGGINIVSKRAGDDPLTRLTAMFQSDANFGLHLDAARRFGANKEWGIRLNGLYRDGEASIDGGDVENRLGALGIDYRGDRVRWSFDAVAQRDDTDNFRPQISLSSLNNGIPDPPDARSNWYPGTTLVQKDTTVATRLEFDVTDALTVYGAVGYRDGENDQIFPVSSRPGVEMNGDFTVGNSYYDSYSETASGTVGARWKFDTGFVGHRLNVGYSGFYQESGYAYISSAESAQSNIYDPAPLPDITADRTDPSRSAETRLNSVAISDTLSFLDERVLLTLGVRDQTVEVESYSITTGAKTSAYKKSVTSPLAGLVVKPWENVAVYANYAEGLTRGTIVGASYTNVGEVLAPYVSEQYEVGVKVDWGTVTTTAAVFELSRPNSIVTAANELAYDGEQRNRGLELTAFGELVPGLRGTASVTFLDPELTKTQNNVDRGNDAAGVPDTTFSGGLDWDVPWVRGLSLNGRVIYTSGAYLTSANDVRFDDWTRVDIGARYALEVGKTPVVLRANVENLFDEEYWLTTGTYATVGPPLTALLSASVDF